jgi:predicted DCC family thiol-disulfide oxidoreductase YuxK
MSLANSLNPKSISKSTFVSFMGIILLTKFFSLDWQVISGPFESFPATNLIVILVKILYVLLSFYLMINKQTKIALSYFLLFFGLLLFTNLFGNTHIWLIFLLLCIFAAEEFSQINSGYSHFWAFPFKMQLSIVYLFAALNKINIQFLSGSSLNFFYSLSPKSRSLQDYIPIDSNIFFYISLIALVVELFLSVAFWFKSTKSLALFIGCALHLNILFFLAQDTKVGFELLTYGLLMYLLMSVFWIPIDKQMHIIWDDSCTFCAKFIRFFRFFNLNGAIKFSGSSEFENYKTYDIPQEDIFFAIQLVDTRSMRRYQGYDAIAFALTSNPLLLWMYPVSQFYLIKILGRLVYKKVAISRTCAVDLKSK